MLVGDSLGGSENLLLALTLTTLGVNHSVDGAFGGQTRLLNGHLVVGKLSGTADKAGNLVVDKIFGLFSKGIKIMIRGSVLLGELAVNMSSKN